MLIPVCLFVQGLLGKLYLDLHKISISTHCGDLCELWGALSPSPQIVQGNLRSVEALPRAPQIAGKLSLQLMSSTFKWPRLLRARPRQHNSPRCSTPSRQSPRQPCGRVNSGSRPRNLADQGEWYGNLLDLPGATCHLVGASCGCPTRGS